MILEGDRYMSPRFLLALTMLLTSSAWAQSVISAHSGVIQYTEGQVTLDGKTIQPKFAEFPDVKVGQTLAAQDGRTEVLLTPGVFLRVAENSSVRMVSNKLADTKVEIVSGTAIVEVSELLQNNAITLQVHDVQIALLKKGLYKIDADDPGRLRVYDGDARVTSSTNATLTAGRGREVVFGAVLEARSFDTKQTDAFYRWAARRDEYVAQANLVAAKSAGNSFYDFGSGLGYGGTSGSGAWAWNPWYGMFTFVPSYGMSMSPFGYSYYSPGTVGYFYGAAYGNGGYINPNSYNAVRTASGMSAVSAPVRSSMATAAARGTSMANGGYAGPANGGFSGSGAAAPAGGGMSGGGMTAGGVGGGARSGGATSSAGRH
jgi:hypothetical protein